MDIQSDGFTTIEFVGGPSDGHVSRIWALPPPGVIYWDVAETSRNRRAWYAYDCERHVYEFVNYDCDAGDEKCE